MTHTESPELADMQARMRPTDAAVRHAVALLQAEPAADLAAIPMAFPGKQYAQWRVGEQVETVPGVVFLGINGFNTPDDSPVPSYAWARSAAAATARLHLYNREGTVGWATVRRDSNWSVSEDILQWTVNEGPR